MAVPGWLVMAGCLLLTACGSVVAGTPEPQASYGGSGGDIRPAQLEDLLTPSMSLSAAPNSPLFEYDLQAALFTGADPAECQGVVGYGRYPLFPANYTGREARTQVDSASNQHQLLEVSATYPGDFDAQGFLGKVHAAVSACQRPVTVWGDDGHKMTVVPDPLVAGVPDVARWATNLIGEQWVCEFSVIAKANVVSQIVTCSADRSIDNQNLVAKRLKKIDELLNSTA